MKPLLGKTIIITGASRGIGRAIAIKFAQDGANLVLAAKTKEPHSTLAGTIDSVAEEVCAAGGTALPFQVDVRDEAGIEAMVKATVSEFGTIDGLINNASAISLTPTIDTSMKKFDLMMSVNARATFACSQAVLPFLLKSKNPHIINIAPPLSMKAKWFAKHVAYTISKYGMSMCTLGMAEELRESKIAVNSLWPKTTIATAAVEVHFPKEILQASRKPVIMADAAYAIITKASDLTTGQFFIDEEVLRAEGVKDFSHYALDPEKALFTDLYVEAS